MEDDRYTRITLRIPRDLHGKLEAAAVETSKSMNAEIIERLRRTFAVEVGGQRGLAVSLPGALGEPGGRGQIDIERVHLEAQYQTFLTQAIALDTQIMSLRQQRMMLEARLSQRPSPKGGAYSEFMKELAYIDSEISRRVADVKAARRLADSFGVRLKAVRAP